jgi:hypothetical protein
VLGPIAGALIAVGFAYILRGRRGDPISIAAGSGTLDPETLRARHHLAQQIERGEMTLSDILARERSAAARSTGESSSGQPSAPPS